MLFRPWYLLSVFILFFNSYAYSQEFQTLRIFQYEGTDSVGKKLAVTRVFNSKNLLVTEIYHQRFSDEGYSYSGIRHCIYRDTFLIRIVGTGRRPGDSTKSFFFYNERGLLIKAESFRYEKKLKPEVDKGLGRPGGCIIVADDYEANRTWQQGPISTYQYDSRGRRIGYKLLYSDSTVSEQRRCYYNRLGRLRELQSFGGAGEVNPSYQWFYSYSLRGRLRKTISYSYGSLSGEEYCTYHRKTTNEDGGYSSYPGAEFSEYHKVRKVDSKGRLIEEVDYAGRCPLETRKTTRYYPDGKIAQTILFTCRDSSRVVHDYVYQ